MSDRARLWFSALAILAVALTVWLPTIGWGLPSRDADQYLFGDRRPWTGAEIVALTTTTQPATIRGADVDADPIVDRSTPVVLNDTDAKRAAIVRRYRLMSGQPDEFIQFKALSEMAARPGLAKLDPRLYQYGGLWMYPVGALVRTAMLVGIIEGPPPGTPAIEFYLDHPEAFGRFYVVARFYSWCWGLVAAFAIAWIARRVTQSIGLATLAAVAFMLLPVTRTATHEAKPHLAGAALCLCAVIAATRYVETGRRRWLLGAGALCGAAMAMVVSMLLACAVLPTMVWLRRREERSWHGRPGRDDPPSAKPADAHGRDAHATNAASSLAISIVVAVAVYVATNPFVVVNAIVQPEILRSNFGNSTAMYSAKSGGVHAFISAMRIVAASTTPTWMWIGLIMIAGLAFRAIVTRSHLNVLTVLLATPALMVTLQFVALAAGKAAEYGRFGLLPMAASCVAGAYAMANLARLRIAGLFAIVIAALFGFIGLIGPELYQLERASGLVTTETIVRVSEAERKLSAPVETIGLLFEPAPWSAPPLNLFRLKLLLASRHKNATAYDLLTWPSNLSTQIGHDATDDESVDWLYNGFDTRWHVNSSSRPAGSRPGG